VQIPVEVSGRGHEITPDEGARIRTEVDRLERFYDRLTGCKVVISVPHRHPTGRAVAYLTRLILEVPGGELVITRQPKPTVREALDDAFHAARRRLQDHARELRGDVKTPTPMTLGRVSRLHRGEGYGFLTSDDGREVYFHRHSVLKDGFDRLRLGARVRFVEEPGEEGPQASSVALTGTRRTQRT